MNKLETPPQAPNTPENRRKTNDERREKNREMDRIEAELKEINFPPDVFLAATNVDPEKWATTPCGKLIPRLKSPEEQHDRTGWMILEVIQDFDKATGVPPHDRSDEKIKRYCQLLVETSPDVAEVWKGNAPESPEK